MKGSAQETVFLAAGVVEAIVEHARREAPRECCGLLVGEGSRIDESVPAENVAAGRTRYLVNPSDHIDLNRRLRGTERAVVGVYHSHPDSRPEPSPTDIAEAHYPEFLHIIVSLIGDPQARVRGYRISSGRAAPVVLQDERHGE